jgi:hypothetical protein
VTYYDELPYWKAYDTDPSFRQFVDMGNYAPEYTFAYKFRHLRRNKPEAAVAA